MRQTAFGAPTQLTQQKLNALSTMAGLRDRTEAILKDIELGSTGNLIGDLAAAAAVIGVAPAESVFDTLARLEAVLTGTGAESAAPSSPRHRSPSPRRRDRGRSLQCRRLSSHREPVEVEDAHSSRSRSRDRNHWRCRSPSSPSPPRVDVAPPTPVDSDDELIARAKAYERELVEDQMKRALRRVHVARVLIQAGAAERQARQECRRDADYLAGRFEEPDYESTPALRDDAPRRAPPEIYKCGGCDRAFTTLSGRSNHHRYCEAGRDTPRPPSWTSDEEAHLRTLVRTLVGKETWNTIAERLGTGRTGRAVGQKWGKLKAKNASAPPPPPVAPAPAPAAERSNKS